ncbi:MAG: EcsC family protein [Candidatus Dadabacteria bacterium]|nr:EcsC family protein [Candidatus Dadabacteria bacterium]
MARKKITEYDEKAIQEIHIWKSPKLSFFNKFVSKLSKPLDKIANKVPRKFSQNQVIDAIGKSVEGVIKVTNDASQWTVRPDSIMKEFNKRGYKLRTLKGIKRIKLEEIDKIVGWLDAKYKGIATLEGGTTGAAGLFGIPADVVAIIALNFRAVGEYATYYGYDISTQQERLFALNVLGLASSPSDAAKEVALAQLVKIASDVAKKRTWKELEQHLFVQITRNIAKAVGIRLTKAKLAQFIPYIGAVFGAGFNAYYTSKVCEAAYYLYRERFLAEKYGAEVIEITVNPAKDLSPNYKEIKENFQIRKRG